MATKRLSSKCSTSIVRACACDPGRADRLHPGCRRHRAGMLPRSGCCAAGFAARLPLRRRRQPISQAPQVDRLADEIAQVMALELVNSQAPSSRACIVPAPPSLLPVAFSRRLPHGRGSERRRGCARASGRIRNPRSTESGAQVPETPAACLLIVIPEYADDGSSSVERYRTSYESDTDEILLSRSLPGKILEHYGYAKAG